MHSSSTEQNNCQTCFKEHCDYLNHHFPVFIQMTYRKEFAEVARQKICPHQKQGSNYPKSNPVNNKCLTCFNMRESVLAEDFSPSDVALIREPLHAILQQRICDHQKSESHSPESNIPGNTTIQQQTYQHKKPQFMARG